MLIEGICAFFAWHCAKVFPLHKRHWKGLLHIEKFHIVFTLLEIFESLNFFHISYLPRKSFEALLFIEYTLNSLLSVDDLWGVLVLWKIFKRTSIKNVFFKGL